MNKKTIHPLLMLAITILLCTSCITPRRVNYLQDMKQSSQIELENRFEAVVSPYDELNIIVTCPTAPELAVPFNMGNHNQSFNNNNNGYGGYLVDVNGNIQFPAVGDIHVAGLTRLELQDTLRHILVVNNLLEEPFVHVRFRNFKIFFIGSGKGGTLTINNERCTFLEALAMHGGLDNYTRRDRIGVMREVDGKMVLRYLDPRSSDVFNDPFFMLQQNDFIITEQTNGGTWRSEFGYWTGLVSTALSFASLISTILLYNTMK